MGIFDFIKEKIGLNSKKDKYLSGFSATNQKIDAKLKKIYDMSLEDKDSFLEELMITLLEADIGYETAEKICDLFYAKTKEQKFLSSRDLKYLLYDSFYEIYGDKEVRDLNFNTSGPTVILMVGVNGSGKTTSSAKLANLFKEQGKKVALAAADTFRAGAIEQLKRWGERLEIPVIEGSDNEDPSSVLVRASRYAKENNIDILICDSAGRLQNKVNLMNELAKMNKVLNKEIPNAPHETFLVLDANTGQNGLSQAKLFNEVTNLTSIILTKMDGTSKGGIIIAVKDLTKIPVRYIGLGEGVDDLEEFYLELYLYSILGELYND